MANGKYNIEQIRRYLNGELDARAMYELERQAHADPFLWDMIRGMESGTEDDEVQLKAIDQLITERIKRDEKRIVPLWKPLSIAASILIVLGIGGWLFLHQPEKPVVALNAPQVQQPDQLKVDTPAAAKPLLPKGGPIVAQADHHEQKPTTVRQATQPAAASIAALPDTNYRYQQGLLANKVDTSLLVRKANTASVIAKNADKPTLAEVSVNGKLLRAVTIKKDTFSRELIAKAEGAKVDDGFLTGRPLKRSDALAQNLPLYIIDGIPVADFKPGSIKPSDIKNITEIKDSAATKIYGSRASNGVIAINTKKGATAGNSGYMYKNTETPVAAGRVVEAKSRNKLDSAYKDLSKALAGAVNSNIVKGKVVDKDGREPLPGVSVTVTGTTKATQTDLNGNFIISLPTGKELLSIAYIGYMTQQVKVKSRDSLNIALTPSSASLNEVAVTGYGTRKEEPAEVTDAAPAVGWKAYDKYLREGATMPDGRTGVVKLSVMISGNGTITDIKVVKGLSDDMNQKAIRLIKYGPAWTPESDHKPQQITVRIKFHK